MPDRRTDPATPSPSPSPSPRAIAGPLTAVVAFHVALMLVWSVVVPTFRGADEHVQHDFLRRLTDTWDYPEFDELRVSQRTLGTQAASPVYPAQAPPADGDQAAPRSERASWAELGADIRDGPYNQLAQHPPLYYVPTAAVLRLIDGDGAAPVDRVVWQLRLLNVLTLAPLPLLAADIARRFTGSRTVVVSAAIAIVAVPQLTHVGATLSNDPVMILFGSVALAGVARLLTGDRRWAIAVITGVASGLALLSKGFAVPLVPAVAVACVLLVARRSGGEGGGNTPRRRDLGIACVVAVLALLSGGWWWIRNVVVHGNPQPGVRLRERAGDVDVNVFRFAGDFSERLVGSFWGNVGWREAHLPIGISAVLTVALVVAVAAACWQHWGRLVLVVPAVVAAAMVLSAGWGAYKKTGVSYATQGRYLYAGIAALAALAAAGIARLAGPRIGRHQATATMGVAVLVQVTMLVIAVRRYWAGRGFQRIESMSDFSPLPDVATLVLLVLAVATAGWATVAVARDRGTGRRSAVGRAQHH